MMRYLSVYFFFCLLIVVASCNYHESGGNPTVIKCDECAPYRQVSEVLDSLNFLVLDGDFNDSPSHVDKALISDSLLCLADYQRQMVFIYAKDGTRKAVLDRRGRGPGEYVHMQSVCANDEYLFVMDSFSEKIIAYRFHDLSYSHELVPPCLAWDFAALGDGGFLFAYAPTEGAPFVASDERFRLVVADSTMQVKKRMLPYKIDEKDAVVNRACLRESGESIVYQSFSDEKIYCIDKKDGEVSRIYELSLSSPLPVGVGNQIEMIESKQYSYVTAPPYLLGEDMILELSIKSRSRLLMYEADSATFYANPEDCLYLMGLIGSDEENLYAYWPGELFYDAFVKSSGLRAAPDIERRILNGSPYIVIYSRRTSL